MLHTTYSGINRIIGRLLQLGRRLVPRSEPPQTKKVHDEIAEQASREEEELAYYFMPWPPLNLIFIDVILFNCLISCYRLFCKWNGQSIEWFYNTHWRSLRYQIGLTVSWRWLSSENDYNTIPNFSSDFLSTYLQGGPKKRNLGFNFAITSVNVQRLSPSFHRSNKKCMTHKSKITPATSPLFCNPLPSKTHYC